MIFDTEFFPTPTKVIERMVEPFAFDWSDYSKKFAGCGRSIGGRRILDPSAGSGSILSYIKGNLDNTPYHRHQNNTYFAIEIELELRAILKEKGFNPIAFDFLQFQPDQLFDLIVMNPPFSEGVDHLLHAWEILPHGDIVCLLNAETVSNPYTKKRRLLREVIEQHGRHECFGPCFAEAERQTDVEVVCVWLNKPAKESTFNFKKDKFDFERNDSPDIEYGTESDLARPGIIDALADQYQAARAALINTHRARAKYGYYTRNIYRNSSPTERSEKEVTEGAVKSSARKIDAEISELRQRFWSHVFAQTKVMDHTTSNFHKKVKELQAESNGLTFSKENIYALLDHFLTHSSQIMEDCICDIFDEMTAYHAKNKVWVEGWKTNSAYRVNMKIIIPDRGTFIGWNGWEYRSYYNERLWAKLADLDKMLCWVMALSHDEVVFVNDAISAHCEKVKAGEIEYSEKFVSTFFELRIYKKGTVHLKFREVAVWEKFNGRVAQIRKWIAPAEAENEQELEDSPPWETEEEAQERIEQMGLLLI